MPPSYFQNCLQQHCISIDMCSDPASGGKSYPGGAKQARADHIKSVLLTLFLHQDKI